MAKNKVKGRKDEELIDQDEVIYEEEMESDDVGQEEGVNFLEKYRNYLIVGGIAIAALFVFMTFQSSSKDQLNLEGQVDMIVPTMFYERDSTALAITGNGQVMGFESIVDDYDGTDAGNLSKYYLGTAFLKQGQLDQGINYLEEFSKGSNMVSAAAYAGLGYAYEQKSDFASAAENYEKAARTPSENKFSTPFYLMHAARNFESAGNNEEALSIYKQVWDKYPNSVEVTEGSVEKYIAKLGGDSDE